MAGSFSEFGLLEFARTRALVFAVVHKNVTFELLQECDVSNGSAKSIKLVPRWASTIALMRFLYSMQSI